MRMAQLTEQSEQRGGVTGVNTLSALDDVNMTSSDKECDNTDKMTQSQQDRDFIVSDESDLSDQGLYMSSKGDM